MAEASGAVWEVDMRLIDAGELKAQILETIKVYKTNGYFDEPLARFCKMLREEIKAIDHAPTIEAEPVKHGEWIPIEERLPELSGEYLCEYKMNGLLFHYVLHYWIDDPVWGTGWHRMGDMLDSITDNSAGLIAWMPLPEPYEE